MLGVGGEAGSDGGARVFLLGTEELDDGGLGSAGALLEEDLLEGVWLHDGGVELGRGRACGAGVEDHAGRPVDAPGEEAERGRAVLDEAGGA